MIPVVLMQLTCCLLYTSDAADERSSVDLGGRRIIKKKTNDHIEESSIVVPRQYNSEAETKPTPVHST